MDGGWARCFGPQLMKEIFGGASSGCRGAVDLNGHFIPLHSRRRHGCRIDSGLHRPRRYFILPHLLFLFTCNASLPTWFWSSGSNIHRIAGTFYPRLKLTGMTCSPRTRLAPFRCRSAASGTFAPASRAVPLLLVAWPPDYTAVRCLRFTTGRNAGQR